MFMYCLPCTCCSVCHVLLCSVCLVLCLLCRFNSLADVWWFMSPHCFHLFLCLDSSVCDVYLLVYVVLWFSVCLLIVIVLRYVHAHQCTFLLPVSSLILLHQYTLYVHMSSDLLSWSVSCLYMSFVLFITFMRRYFSVASWVSMVHCQSQLILLFCRSHYRLRFNWHLWQCYSNLMTVLQWSDFISSNIPHVQFDKLILCAHSRTSIWIEVLPLVLRFWFIG